MKAEGIAMPELEVAAVAAAVVTAAITVVIIRAVIALWYRVPLPILSLIHI